MNLYDCSDKTVRAWRWVVGQGFVEESFSPLLGHKYGVTSVRISPQVSSECIIIFLQITIFKKSRAF